MSSREKGGYSPRPEVYDLANLPNAPVGPAIGARAGRKAMPGAANEPPGGYTFTRDALVDALTRIELRVALSGPVAGKILAESMADAIIEALGCAAGNPVARTGEDGERDQ